MAVNENIAPNTTPEQASYLRGKRYLAEKKEYKGNQYTSALDQNDPKQNHTADRLAGEFNVSAPTIKRDAKFAEAVDLIAHVAPEQASYLRGKRYISEKKTKAEAGSIGGLSKDQNDPCLTDKETTADKLAEEFKVSAPTIKRDAKFAEAVDLIAEVAPRPIASFFLRLPPLIRETNLNKVNADSI